MWQLIRDRDGHVIARQYVDPRDGSVRVFNRDGRFLGRSTSTATFDHFGRRIGYSFAPGMLYQFI